MNQSKDVDSQSFIFLSGVEAATFKDKILEVCDETLLILGPIVRDSTYQWVRVNYGIDREEIPENFVKFIEALQSIYGLNANVILIGLATILCRQFKLKEEYNYQQLGLKELVKIYVECQKRLLLI